MPENDGTAALETPAPAETPAEQPAAEAPEATPPAEQPPAADDWRVKFEAQQKVNRDLERKLKSSDDNRTRVSELEGKLAKLEGKEAEFQAEQEKRATEQAALAKANERILKAEIRAAAAGKLADPADALQFLDLSALEVSADGEVDSDAVTSAIEDLVKTKPYLAAQGGKRFQGTADGGARNGASKLTQLTEADVDRLYAEGRHDEIVKAKAEGRLVDYFGKS